MAVYDDKVPGGNKLPDNQKTPVNAPSSEFDPAKVVGGGAGALKQAEQAGAEGEQSGLGGAVNAARLAAMEAASAGGGFGAAFQAGKRISRLWGADKRKPLIGGVSIAGIVTMIFMAIIMFSGPAKYVQRAETLKRDMASTEQAASDRGNQELKFAGAKDIGETRLGTLGRQILRPKLAALNEMGVSFKTNGLGGLRATEIDPEKLANKYPELKDMSVDERRAWIENRFEGVPANSITESGGKFTIDGTDFPLKTTSLLQKGSLDLLADGRTMTALNNRVFSTYFDIPSLFKPFDRLTADKVHQAANASAKAAEDKVEQEREARLTQSAEAQGDDAVKHIEEESSKYNSFLMKSLLLTGGVCFVRSTAGDIIEVNNARVKLPAMIRAADIITIADSIRSGRGPTMDQLSSLDKSFGDDKDHSLEQGKAYQVTAGSTNPGGKDLPEDYKLAFKSNTTASHIRDWAGGKLGALGCSKVGLFVQAIVGLGASAASAFGEVASGGTLTPAIVGLWAAKEGASFAISATAMHFVQEFVLNKATLAKLGAKAFQGDLGGNLIAYGARALSNLGAIAEGGIPLSSADVAQLDSQAQAQQQAEFQSRGVFAKMFDIYDTHSLANKVATSFSPSMSANFTHAATSITHIGSLFRPIFAPFLPKTDAAYNYDWGFPVYGIPVSMLNDPDMANPYANGTNVAHLLATGQHQDLIDKASTCFGAKLSADSGVWDVTYASNKPVDTNSDDYSGANCGDTSDPNWKHVIMFIFDTHNMKATACYDGDDQSCSDIGAGGSAAGSSSTADTTSTAGASIDMASLTQDSSEVGCADNTKDVGVQDGYTQGNKVRIRLCAIPNLPSHGEESLGGYGISGANGKAIVNSRVSGAVYAMVEAARKDGVNLTANSSFRTMAHQQCLYAHTCGQNTAAQPGYSNHQMGLAIDFDGAGNGPAPGSGPAWNWLSKNADKFGYKNWPQEAWHWSPTGN